MIVINTQEELEALIDDDNNIVIDGNLEINCKIIIKANIKAGNIKARDIKAGNIEALDIKAWDISYYAVCFAYTSINCKSIKGRRANSKHFALDGEITIINNNK